MTAGGALLVSLALGSLIWAALFGGSKPKWRPLRGIFRQDRRTGEVAMVLWPGSGKGKRKKGRRR